MGTVGTFEDAKGMNVEHKSLYQMLRHTFTPLYQLKSKLILFASLDLSPDSPVNLQYPLSLKLG